MQSTVKGFQDINEELIFHEHSKDRNHVLQINTLNNTDPQL